MRSIYVIALVPLLAACAIHPPTRSGSAIVAEQTPTERYEAYRAALAHASRLEELYPLTSEAVREEMAKRPEAFRSALLVDLQARRAEWLRVVDERVVGNNARLSVEGEQIVDPSKGTRSFGRARVLLVREGSTWRIDEEIWTLQGTDSSEIVPRAWSSKSPTKQP
jgi:hypothetical protein